MYCFAEQLSHDINPLMLIVLRAVKITFLNVTILDVSIKLYTGKKELVLVSLEPLKLFKYSAIFGASCQRNACLKWSSGLEKRPRKPLPSLQYNLTLGCKAFVLGGWKDGYDNLVFSIHRCSFSKELSPDLQEDTLSAFSGVCSCLHPSLRPYHPYGGWGPCQHLLQAFLLFCDRA